MRPSPLHPSHCDSHPLSFAPRRLAQKRRAPTAGWHGLCSDYRLTRHTHANGEPSRAVLRTWERRTNATAVGVDLDSIADRTAIRKSVQSGNVQDAIERVNDLNPEVSRAHHHPCCTYTHPSRRAREVRMWVGLADSGGARAAILPPAAAAAHRAHPRGQHRAGAGVCAGVPSAPWGGERTAPAVNVARDTLRTVLTLLPAHQPPCRHYYGTTRRLEAGYEFSCCCARTTSPDAACQGRGCDESAGWRWRAVARSFMFVC